MKNIILSAILTLASSAQATNQCPATNQSPVVTVLETTIDRNTIRGLQPKADLKFQAPEVDGLQVYEIHPDHQFQRMDGFGASFTEACTTNLMKLPAAMRADVMQKLFSKTNGAGFDVVRLPIGMSDFSDDRHGDWSYDEPPNHQPDPTFKYFDVSHDEKTFELIRQARVINPNLHVLISPWSPPTWMKTSKKIRGGEVKPEYYADLANYFMKVITAYKNRGIPVTSMTVQNEPGYDGDQVPTTGMSAENEAKFIGQFLGPQLVQAAQDVQIFVHDHNWDQAESLPNQILNDSKAKQFSAGVAYHCYGGYRWDMLESMKKFPDVPTFQTECSGSMGTQPVDDFHWWMDNQSLDAVNMGTTGALAWNLCLDQNGGPRVKKSCDDCRGMVTLDFSKRQPKAIYNAEYYALAQVSRVIVPGARRIEVRAWRQGDNPKVISFLNPDGTIAFIAQNSEQRPVKVRIQMSSCQTFTYEIPAKGAVSFKWRTNEHVAAGPAVSPVG